MLTAVVEGDGRIRLPDEVREIAHLEPGQEIEVAVEGGVISLFAPGDDEPHYSEEFLAGLRRAIAETDAGNGTVYESGEAFLAAIDREL